MTGGMATLAHYGVYAVGTTGLGWVAALASGLGALLGAVISYLLNYFFTFESTQRHGKSVLRFVFMVCVGLTLNTAIVYFTVDVFMWNKWAFQFVATAIVFFWSFWFSKNWVFV